VKFFNLISKIHLTALSRKICNKVPKQFYDAVNYLIDKYEKYDTSPEVVYLNIIVFAFVGSLIFSFMILLVFVKDLLIFSFIFMFSLISIYLFLYYWIINEYERDKLIIHVYYFIALKDMLLAYSSTKSILEAIKFVILGGYPLISDIWKNIIKNVYNGLNPEVVLINKNIMRFDKHFDSQLSKMLSEFKNENYSLQEISILYDKLFAKLEVYSLLLLFIGFFLPLASLFIATYTKSIIMEVKVAVLFIIIQIIVPTIYSRFLLSRIYGAINVEK